MESRSNYRVVIDLSKYFNDARKLSCVYTNENSMSHVVHLKERISNVFKIPGEFHLVAVVAGTEIYLPPNEDIRIIEENEVIQVVPGSGVDDFLLWKDMAVKHDGKPLEALQVLKNPENVSVRVTKPHNGAAIHGNSVNSIGQSVNVVNNEKRVINGQNYLPVQQNNQLKFTQIERPNDYSFKLPPKTTQSYTNTIDYKNTIKGLNNGENNLNHESYTTVGNFSTINNRIIASYLRMPLVKPPISSMPTFSSGTVPKKNPTDQQITADKIDSCSENSPSNKRVITPLARMPTFPYETISKKNSTDQQITADKIKSCSENSPSNNRVITSLPPMPIVSSGTIPKKNPTDQTIATVEIESCSENSPSESEQSTANNLNESSDVSTVSRKKRKRIRKRKAKNTTEKLPMTCEIIDQKKKFSAVKIEVPVKAKHVKFDWNDDNQEKKNYETSSLSNLLSLKNSPVPTVFSGKKLVNVEKVEHEKSESEKDCQVQSDKENNQIKNDIPMLKKSIPDFSKINPLDYPLCHSIFQTDDIIAFRVLRIGEDYTPGISGNVTAKILEVDSTNKTYKLQILTGKDQLKEPEGKFSLKQIDGDEMEVEEEEEEDASSKEPEIIETNWSELIEPRLIFRAL